MKNMVVAQDIVHKIKKHLGNEGLMSLKINMKKAYDQIEWGS